VFLSPDCGSYGGSVIIQMELLAGITRCANIGDDSTASNTAGLISIQYPNDQFYTCVLGFIKQGRGHFYFNSGSTGDDL
jgi:hypothetical protein